MGDDLRRQALAQVELESSITVLNKAVEVQKLAGVSAKKKLVQIVGLAQVLRASSLKEQQGQQGPSIRQMSSLAMLAYQT